MQSRGVVGRGVSREKLEGVSGGVVIEKGGVAHTVLRFLGRRGILGSPAGGIQLLAIPPRRLWRSRLGLLSLLRRLPLCYSRRCCAMIVCSLLLLMCLSILLLGAPDRRLCGRPWAPARLGGGLDMCCSGGRMWGRCRMSVCPLGLEMFVPWGAVYVVYS